MRVCSRLQFGESFGTVTDSTMWVYYRPVRLLKYIRGTMIMLLKVLTMTLRKLQSLMIRWFLWMLGGNFHPLWRNSVSLGILQEHVLSYCIAEYYAALISVCFVWYEKATPAILHHWPSALLYLLPPFFSLSLSPHICHCQRAGNFDR